MTVPSQISMLYMTLYVYVCMHNIIQLSLTSPVQKRGSSTHCVCVCVTVLTGAVGT